MSLTNLARLLARLRAAGLLVRTHGRAAPDAGFTHLTADSRKVRSGSLFAAVRGREADGHRFLDNAVKHGATAILCEAVPAGLSLTGADLAQGPVWIVVTDANRFIWPGPDLRPRKIGDATSVAYGVLPATVYEELRAKFIKAVEARLAAAVPRTQV